MSDPKDNEFSDFMYVGPGGAAPGLQCSGGSGGRASTVEFLQARVAELEKRLEIDHVFVGPDMVREEVPPEKRRDMVDGITARDSTITILRQNNEKLRARVAELEMDKAELAGLDAKCSALSIENAQLRYQIKHGIGSGGDGGAAGEPGKPGK